MDGVRSYDVERPISFSDFLSQADKHSTSKHQKYSLATILDIFETQSKNVLATSEIEDLGLSNITSPFKSRRTGVKLSKRPQESNHSNYIVIRSKKATNNTSGNNSASRQPNTDDSDSGTKSDKNENESSWSESPNSENNPCVPHSTFKPVTSLSGAASESGDSEANMESIGHAPRDRDAFNPPKYVGGAYDVLLPPIGLLVENGTVMRPERIEADIKHKVAEGMTRLSRKIRVDDRLKIEEWIGLEIQLERQMWKRKLQDAMKEIEKQRKIAVATSSKLHEFSRNIVNIYPLDLPSSVFDEELNEFLRLQLILSSVFSELENFIRDKQKCMETLFLRRESFKACLFEKIDEMKQNYEARLKQASVQEASSQERHKELSNQLCALNDEYVKLSRNYQDLSLVMEERAVMEKKDSQPCGETLATSQKRSKKSSEFSSNSLLAITSSTSHVNSLTEHPSYSFKQQTDSESATVTFRLPTLEFDGASRMSSKTVTKDKTNKPKSLRMRNSSPSVGFGIKLCSRCKKPYRIHDNHKMACRYHSKTQAKTEKFKADGTLELTRLIWECCAGEPDAPPCCSGEHV